MSLCSRFEMINASRNKMRVKACYVMTVATLMACVFAAILGKRVSLNMALCQRLLCWFLRNDGLHRRIITTMVLSVWALPSSPGSSSPSSPGSSSHGSSSSSSPGLSSPGQAVGRHESLTGHNMEKKAKWRLEYQQEAAAAGKAQ